MEIFIKASMRMENLEVQDNITGKIKAISKDILRMDFAVDREYGREELQILINMMVNIKMIKSGDMEYSHGLMEIYIKEIIQLISGRAMVICIGIMVATIKESGLKESKMEKEKYLLYKRDLERDCFSIILLLGLIIKT